MLKYFLGDSMTRKIHDIFDVILKLIALLYGTEFLRYIGCDCDFEKECNVEIQQ